MSLPGQAALVTGASRGIGKEIALELARRGWRVAVNYYNDPQAMVDATVAEIRALGGEVLPPPKVCQFGPTSHAWVEVLLRDWAGSTSIPPTTYSAAKATSA